MSTAARLGLRRALVVHQPIGSNTYGEQLCACDRKWRSGLDYREHLGDAIWLAMHHPAPTTHRPEESPDE